MKHQVKRYHDISCGHTVYGHEGKCIHLHGHNYRIHFVVECISDAAGQLDELGRVVDFSIIKDVLCAWLEKNWDHRFLVFEDDPRGEVLQEIDETVVIVDFNPTAENMAQYLMEHVCPQLLAHHGQQQDLVMNVKPVKVTSITIEETRKCSVTYGE